MMGWGGRVLQLLVRLEGIRAWLLNKGNWALEGPISVFL